MVVTTLTAAKKVETSTLRSAPSRNRQLHTLESNRLSEMTIILAMAKTTMMMLLLRRWLIALLMVVMTKLMIVMLHKGPKSYAPSPKP